MPTMTRTTELHSTTGNQIGVMISAILTTPQYNQDEMRTFLLGEVMNYTAKLPGNGNEADGFRYFINTNAHHAEVVGMWD